MKKPVMTKRFECIYDSAPKIKEKVDLVLKR